MVTTEKRNRSQATITDSKVSLSLNESINIKRFKRLIKQSFFSNKKRTVESDKEQYNQITVKAGRNYSKPDISNFEIREEDRSNSR